MSELLFAVAAALIARYLIVEPAMRASGATDWLEAVRPKTKKGSAIALCLMALPLVIGAFIAYR